MRLYLLWLIILILPFSADAEITFLQLVQVSPSLESLEGRFSQEKYLNSIDATLVSTGEFSYQRGKSMRWEILEPIRNKLLMTPTEITSKQGNTELLRFDADSNPVSVVLSGVFFSVLTADWENLSNYFELSGEIEAQRWHVVLEPLDPAVMQIFSQVELKGDGLLEEIILHENSGDKTTIRLYNQSK